MEWSKQALDNLPRAFEDSTLPSSQWKSSNKGHLGIFSYVFALLSEFIWWMTQYMILWWKTLREKKNGAGNGRREDVACALLFGHFTHNVEANNDDSEMSTVEILAVVPGVRFPKNAGRRTREAVAESIGQLADTFVAPLLGIAIEQRDDTNLVEEQSPSIDQTLVQCFSRLALEGRKGWSYTGPADGFLVTVATCLSEENGWTFDNKAWRISKQDWSENQFCRTSYICQDEVGTRFKGASVRRTTPGVYFQLRSDACVLREKSNGDEGFEESVCVDAGSIPNLSSDKSLENAWKDNPSPVYKTVARSVSVPVACPIISEFVEHIGAGRESDRARGEWKLLVTGLFSAKATVKCCAMCLLRLIDRLSYRMGCIPTVHKDVEVVKTVVRFGAPYGVPRLLNWYNGNDEDVRGWCELQGEGDGMSSRIARLGQECSDIWSHELVSENAETEPLLNMQLETSSPPGKHDHVITAICRGDIEYHHYKLFELDDTGWGCAYRALQTVLSWVLREDISALKQCEHHLLHSEKSSVFGPTIPSHVGIQRILVKVDNKSTSLVGSKEWIGSFEAAKVIQHLTSVNFKHVHFQSGIDLSKYTDILVDHFGKAGGPVIVGGGMLALTIVGAAKRKGQPHRWLLILDPHYHGCRPKTDATGALQSDINASYKSSRAPPLYWQRMDILSNKDQAGPFLKNEFYNICIPALRANSG
eukprot:gb/GECG01014822.1/.p1 GENE.gb/GECG01014822.1/~~gb/GECG01014822.1/.p1  ORF type:complete len:703 (+),score=62.77 gb/GECG01014822.1/:1-2109(+)